MPGPITNNSGNTSALAGPNKKSFGAKFSKLFACIMPAKSLNPQSIGPQISHNSLQEPSQSNHLKSIIPADAAQSRLNPDSKACLDSSQGTEISDVSVESFFGAQTLIPESLDLDQTTGYIPDPSIQQTPQPKTLEKTLIDDTLGETLLEAESFQSEMYNLDTLGNKDQTSGKDASLTRSIKKSYIQQGQYTKADKSLDSASGTNSHSVVTTEDGQRFELLGTLDAQEMDSLLSQHGVDPSSKEPNPIKSKTINPELRKVVLGAGAFGKVRLARNMDTKEIVAVKKYNSVVSQEREHAQASVLKSESHLIKDIAQVKVTNHEGIEKGYQFLELFGSNDGQDLIYELSADSFASPKKTAAIQKSVARGLLRSLEDLHQQNIEHADVKPANVFVKNVGPQKVAKLGDYGTIQKNTPKQWAADDQRISLCGTPQYWSPEVMEKGLVCHAYKRDSFSAGITLLQWAKCERFPTNRPVQIPININDQLTTLENKPSALETNVIGTFFRYKGIENPQFTVNNKGETIPNKGTTLEEVAALLLDANPETRILPQDALNLPYFQ